MKRAGLFVVGVVLAATPMAWTADANNSATAYVRKLQNKDGGFAPTAGKELPSSLRATSAALRALKYFGGAAPDKQAAANFVKSCFDKSTGGFADKPGGKPDVALTAVGLMAVV